MLYFFYGTDRTKTREKAHGVLEIMIKKRPAAEFFRVTADNWEPAVFEGYIRGIGLFEKKFIVFADNLLEKQEAKEWIMPRLEEIASSDNGFIFLESKLDAQAVKKVEKFANKIERFDTKERDGFGSNKSKIVNVGNFNIFSLGDALGEKNKQSLWVAYQKALMIGATPEEISGILFWQTKSMILAKDGASPAEAGLAPFVFFKSKRHASNYSREELTKLSRELVSNYHDAHRGIHDFETVLEKLILNI